MHPKVLLELLQSILPSLQRAAAETPERPLHPVKGLLVELPARELIMRLRETADGLRNPDGQRKQMESLPRIVDPKLRDQMRAAMVEAADPIDFLADHLNADAVFHLTYHELVELEPLLGFRPLFIATPTAPSSVAPRQPPLTN